MAQDKTPASFAALSEDQRVQAMARLTVLRPHLDDGVPLTRTAAAAGVPLRTAQRWLARFRRDGLAGLTRAPRHDTAGTELPLAHGPGQSSTDGPSPADTWTASNR